MYILETDNHIYNIALSFYTDIKDIYKYNLEKSELIMKQHDIGEKQSKKIFYPHFFNLIIKYILRFLNLKNKNKL